MKLTLSMGILVVLLSAPAYAFDSSAARDDLTAIQEEVADVEALLDRGELPGAAQQFARIRLETLKLSAALIQQRLLAEETGAPLREQAPTIQPQPERAEDILLDILAAEQELARAKSESLTTGGLVGDLTKLRVATQELAIAMLRLGHYQARYGLALPKMDVPETATLARSAPDANPLPPRPATAPPAWADSRYPDIDYSAPWYAAAAEMDRSTIAGTWIILKSRAPIDDSQTVTAFTQLNSSSATDTKRLIARCSEGETAFVFDPDTYLFTGLSEGVDVEYRIGSSPAQSARWSTSVSREHAGLWGNEAIAMLRQLRKSKRVFVRVHERSGATHSGNFDIRGIVDVVEEIASACGWSAAALSSDDIKVVQRALLHAGYYNGAIDGIWGPGSRSALVQFQAANNLDKTGSLNDETLKVLGALAQPEPQAKAERTESGANELSSILDNVMKLREGHPAVPETPEAAPERPTVVADERSVYERALREQIQRCWRLDPGAVRAEDLIVELRVFLNPDGSARLIEIVDFERMTRDTYFNSAAENARRAVLTCQPFKLDPRKYNVWRELILRLDPREIIG